MAYAHQILKVTFGGTLFNGKEIWSNGINMGHEDKDVDLDTFMTSKEAYLNDIAAHVRDWFTDTRSGISNVAKLEWVKIAVVGTDGKYVGDPLIFDFATPYTGPFERSSLPAQCTVALSMKTEIRRGPGRDGRIYPPVSGEVDKANGTDLVPDQKMEGFKDFIEGLNLVGLRDLSNDFYVIVASTGGKSGVPLNAKVTSVRVGNVIDTMRSRRNAFKEFYYEARITPDIVLDQHAP